MCNLGDPLTAGEMLEGLRDVPPDAQIKFTSWNGGGDVVTFTVHRVDYPVRSVLGGEPAVWLSFDAYKES